jgi:hypothetical protein
MTYLLYIGDQVLHRVQHDKSLSASVFNLSALAFLKHHIQLLFKLQPEVQIEQVQQIKTLS